MCVDRTTENLGRLERTYKAKMIKEEIGLSKHGQICVLLFAFGGI